MTIEDPIEYEHTHNQSVIEQVEIGIDAPDFPTALRAAMRQAPDVIVVGEMRDPETARIALSRRPRRGTLFLRLYIRLTPHRLSRALPIPSLKNANTRCVLRWQWPWRQC